MRTALTDLLPMTVPVVAAPMAGVADARLAVAVGRAGALGCIGIGSTRTADWVADQLDRATEAAVPYGVGLMAWALPHDETPFELVLEAKPALLSLSFGDVSPWVSKARAAGIPVVVQVGTAVEAVEAQQAGASIVVARGGEAGGHGRNKVATLPLLQQVLDSVKVPVLAAGGIASARGLAAVLAAGAAGAWVGTAFAGCHEATTAPAVRAALDDADATSTTYTRVFDIAQRIPWPVEFGGRALTNDFTRTWTGREDELAAEIDSRAGDPDGGIPERMRRARQDANVAIAPVYCGQGVGQIRVDVPAAEVVAEFARAGELLRAASRLA